MADSAHTSSHAPTHSVRSHLRLEIDSYDDTIRKFIPGYEVGLTYAAELVASRCPDLVLDLGAGTGALSEAILKRLPGGRLHAIDLDAEMLDKARLRLQAFAPCVSFSHRSFLDPLPACDAVTASLALHHLPTPDEKLALYRHIYAALRPAGLMVNVDVTMSAEADTRRASFERWADHLVANGISRARAFEHFHEWSQEDTYLPLDVELDLMSQAGFRAECLWQQAPNCILVGYKQGNPPSA